ncbi:hypothetical protein MKY66_02265 [Paenibacillus sp. FSL R5-0766]|uniref:hypothetical protein n=1 Tax=Paenibacillus sp. FSL R5-0766 TaxID=2921658 RepID=UPI0030D90EAE
MSNQVCDSSFVKDSAVFQPKQFRGLYFEWLLINRDQWWANCSNVKKLAGKVKSFSSWIKQNLNVSNLFGMTKNEVQGQHTAGVGKNDRT